jgi:hypothetical protein
MNSHSSSGKVSYDLRPRKQVERRMMLHTFQRLSEIGFKISAYRYAGFGAFFFVDFILFHRLLGISDMVSIEYDTSQMDRVLFNRPFKEIDVRFEPSWDYISTMDTSKPHILWLDYDGPIANEYLLDFYSAVSQMAPGSVLVGTFDVDFDKANDLSIRDCLPAARPAAWYHRFSEQCGDYFSPDWQIVDFGASDIRNRTIEMVRAAISSGLNMRPGFEFVPLFLFAYADGHEMLTIGGMVASKQDKKKLKAISQADKPFRIEVPVLTRKERLHIDSHMPCDDGWTPEFGIDCEAIKSYRDIYRYCPLYAELML